jgi:hypothetical protein
MQGDVAFYSLQEIKRLYPCSDVGKPPSQHARLSKHPCVRIAHRKSVRPCASQVSPPVLVQFHWHFRIGRAAATSNSHPPAAADAHRETEMYILLSHQNKHTQQFRGVFCSPPAPPLLGRNVKSTRVERVDSKDSLHPGS